MPVLYSNMLFVFFY